MESTHQIETYASTLHQKGNQLFEDAKFQEAIEVYEQASRAFEKEGNIEGYLFCLTDIGWCYIEQFDFKKALPFIEDTLQKCLDILGKTHEHTLQNYHNLAFYFYQTEEYKKAIEFFQIAWNTIEEVYGIKDSRLLALCNDIGLSYQELRQYDKAFLYFQKGIELVQLQQKKVSIQAATIYGSLGALYWILGNLNKSLYFINKALEVTQSVNKYQSYNTLIHCGNLAIIYCDKGDHKKALSYQKKALNICHNLLGDKHPNTGIIYANLGSFYGKTGDWKESIHYHQKALLLRMELYGEHHRHTATSYYNLGEILLHHENSEEGVVYHEQALRIFQATFGEDCEEVAQIYSNLGFYYALAAGQSAKGLEYLSKSLTIRKKVLGEKHFKIIDTYLNIGDVYLVMDKPKEAAFYFHQIFKVTDLGKQHFHLANAYLSLGKCAFQQLQLETSLQYFQKALQSLVMGYSSNHPYHIPSLNQKNLGAGVLLKILKTKAQVLFHKKLNISHCMAALMHCQVALQLIEKTYKSFNNAESKLALASQTFEVLEMGLEIAYFLAESNDSLESASNKMAKINEEFHPPMDYHYVSTSNDCLKNAFHFSEKSKAFLLLSNLQDSQAKYEAAIPEDLLQQEYHLKVELTYSQQRIQQLKTKESEGELEKNEIWELQSKYFDDHQAYQQLIEQFEQNYPEYYQLKYKIQTIEVEELQKSLAKNQLLIEYFIGEKYIYIFGITSNGFEVLQQEKPKHFNQLIKDFNKGINRLMFKKYVQAAHELHQILIAPILELSEQALQHSIFKPHSTIQQYNNKAIQQLIIIPHDILSTLPFEALLCSLPAKNAFLQYSDLDYLLLHYDVVYHYSATLWWQGQKDKQEQSAKGQRMEESFVGFAPVYQGSFEQELLDKKELTLMKHSKESIVSTEHPQHPQHPKEVAGVRSIRIGGKKYKALLYSEVEVNGIKAAFEAQRLPQSTFLHEQATKSNFEAAVKGKKYVLIAAHGFYNKKQPELSGIIFSPNTADSEEAVLYVNDAYHLDLKQTDLVVLSACESGIGKLAKGEGMMAVNRGFLYSGAKNVIFTLFKVYDEQSSELTQALFKYILEGKKYAQALRLAKLDLIQKSDIEPKAWAGFVMIGG